MLTLKRLALALIILSASHFSIAQTPDAELRALLKETVNDASSFGDRFDAEVWLVDMSKRLKRYIKSPEERLIS